jgi:hypothetical protein
MRSHNAIITTNKSKTYMIRVSRCSSKQAFILKTAMADNKLLAKLWIEADVNNQYSMGNYLSFVKFTSHIHDNGKPVYKTFKCVFIF